MSEHKTLLKNGMWSNNPALVQLLGLCPLLAVSSTVTNALGLGIATLLVLVGSNVSVSLIRNHVPKEIRIPVFRHDHRVFSKLRAIADECLCLRTLSFSWDFHSFDRYQLHHHRPRRSVCL